MCAEDHPDWKRKGTSVCALQVASNRNGGQGLREQRMEHEDASSNMPRRILFIDAYDSFSNSIIALLQDALATLQGPPTVEKIYIDEPNFYGHPSDNYAAFRAFLTRFDAVVAGPGPGHPDKLRDVGLMRVLWTLEKNDLLPVLGICLGFQSMCSAAGANVTQLQQPRHGIITELAHAGSSIFSQLGVVKATHYHSLHVNIGHGIQGNLGLRASADLWKPSTSCPSIVPLAWDFSQAGDQGILMAAEIEGKPFWGVQYHPESICSSRGEAKLLMQNWWKRSKAWLKQNRERSSPLEGESSNVLEPAPQSSSASPLEMSGQAPDVQQETRSEYETRMETELDTEVAAAVEALRIYGADSNGIQPKIGPPSSRVPCDVTAQVSVITELSSSLFELAPEGFNHFPDENAWEDESDHASDPPDEDDGELSNDVSDEGDLMVLEREVPLRYGAFKFSPRVEYAKRRIEAPVRKRIMKHLREILDPAAKEFIVLESGQGEKKHNTGRFSILGLVDRQSIKICYYARSRRIEVLRGTTIVHSEINVDFQTYWKSLKQSFAAEGGDPSIPFWGGAFLCYSYEACMETIGVSPVDSTHRDRPDTIGVIIMRSVVIDHHFHGLWIQSIAPSDDRWVESMKLTLDGQLSVFEGLGPEYEEEQLSREQDQEHVLREENRDCTCINFTARVSGPSKSDYEKAVDDCQGEIARGDSYELCLTGQTNVPMPLSRIPHRRTDRDQLLYARLRARNPAPFGAHIQLQLPCGRLTIISSSPERFLAWDRRTKCQFRPIKGTLRKEPGMTMSYAEKYFKSTKERAENLMITDLIRHDLFGALNHPQSVRVPDLFRVEEYQTVYQMVSVIEGRFQNTDKTGFDVLSASLPPGSMTGAPKKRSCELLQGHESEPRGMYSGVIGYDDVGGGGDFSVLIRAAVRWTSDPIDDGLKKCPVHSGWEVWRIGAGGAVTAQSRAKDEYKEMITKREVVLGVFQWASR